MRALCVWLCVCASASAAEPALRYALVSELRLGEAGPGAPAAAARLVADLTVQRAPAPSGGDGDGDELLHFRLQQTEVQSLGAGRADWTTRASLWGARRDERFAARVLRGRVLHALLDPADPEPVLHFKRALVSLFQYEPSPGERNETDVSGDCLVQYETLSDSVFRKIKRRCAQDEQAGVAARRVSRYTRAGGVLRELHAEEVVTLGAPLPAAEDAPPLKARSWLALSLRAERDAPPPDPDHGALRPMSLAAPCLYSDDAPPQDAEEAIEEHRAALEGEEAGAGGDAAAAAALLRLLPALRAAPAPALAAALRSAPRARLAPLSRALGLAGTPAALAAAADFLQLAAADPLEPLAHAFLAGVALAPDAPEEVALAVLKLGEEARHAAVAESALLAAAAAARGPARAAVRAALLRGLARCRDPACRVPRLLALGNLRGEALDALLAHAAGDEPRTAAAALAALRGAALAPAQLERLGAVAINASRPLELRAEALDLVALRRAGSASGAVPVQLARLALALAGERGRAAHELRRVLAGRLAALGARPAARALAAAWPAALRTWEARAAGGRSAVLRRRTGWAAAGALLDSVQVAAAGLLRTARVTLFDETPDGDVDERLEVEVWTRGMQALAGGGDGGGGGGEEEEEEEEVSGGLALSVGGARLRPLRLFAGQAELLGHVWAGTGAEPTAVLRALRPRAPQLAALRLLGGAELTARAAAATALALDAHAAVSLWHRTARGELALRAGAAAERSARALAPGAELVAHSAADAEPALGVAFDLDFYGDVTLCVRAAVPPHARAARAEARSRVGARGHAARRGRRLRAPAAGRTLALGARNDRACRDLRAAD